MIYLFFIPIMLMEFIVGLSPETIGMRSFGGWSPFTYLVIFLLGYILATDDRYRPAIERIRFFSLTLSLLLLAIGYSLEMADISINSYYLAPFRGLNTWAWILTFLGFAIHHLNFNNNFLKYANEAVLAFLHPAPDRDCGGRFLHQGLAVGCFPKVSVPGVGFIYHYHGLV